MGGGGLHREGRFNKFLASKGVGGGGIRDKGLLEALRFNCIMHMLIARAFTRI